MVKDKNNEQNNSSGLDVKEKVDLRREILSWILYFAGAVLVIWFVLTFVGQRTVVSGSSMNDTLSDGDNLILEKLSYRFGDPERFDIIVFQPYEDSDKLYIKRIIGLPGETVYIDEEGNIYIDGELLEEDYGKETIQNPGRASEPITLGEDEYFVLGDNRNNSTDSRSEEVGNVKRASIVGKAWLRFWPIGSFELLTHG